MAEGKHPVDALKEKIIGVILSSGLPYGESMSAINGAQNFLQGKYFNLANAVNIREVVEGKR